MADKQEKELSLASDCEWVRGLDSAGNPIRISKADMVDLIRNNMPVATNYQKGLLPAGMLVNFSLDLEPNQSIFMPGRTLVYMDFSGGQDMCLVSFSYWSYRLLTNESTLNNYVSIKNKEGSLFEVKSINSSKFLFCYSIIAETFR